MCANFSAGYMGHSNDCGVSGAIIFPREGHKYSPPVCSVERQYS